VRNNRRWCREWERYQLAAEPTSEPDEVTVEQSGRASNGLAAKPHNLEEKYHIMPGYRHRLDEVYFDDTLLTDEWQREVYLTAAELMDRYQLSTVYDIGCGSGYKLINYLGKYDTVGFDVPKTVDFLNKRYSDRKWRVGTSVDDLGETDLVICADVIEHCLDPELLLEFIDSISTKYIVISTPDRNLMYSKDDDQFLGPPRNPAHVREWTFDEFGAYIGQRYIILDHQISNRAQATQMIVCQPRTVSEKERSPLLR
jgi:hypothetical protein